MRKHFRMIAGIVLHPVRMYIAWQREVRLQGQIQYGIRENWYNKNHERLHRFDGLDFPNTCSFVHSELHNNMFRGAI